MPGKIKDFSAESDDVLILSFPRSGNTWVRFLLANLVEHESAEPINFHTVHKVIPDLEVAEQQELVTNTLSPRFFKSHILRKDWNFKKAIYVVRDGRDAMVSYYHYLTQLGRFDGDFLRFLALQDLHPCFWHEHVESWLQWQDSHEGLLIRYEDLISNCSRELDTMAQFAGLSCNEDALKSAVSNSTFIAMKKAEQEKGRPLGSSSLQFVRKGELGNWRSLFEKGHIELFKKQANKILLKLGYIDTEDW